jgi:hypothetical protein
MVYCNDATGQRVADCTGEYLFHTDETMRANARLIAAAPELLTQLVGAVALAEHIIASLDIDPETTTLRVRANGENIADIPIATLIENQKAVIAKAEGRS